MPVIAEWRSHLPRHRAPPAQLATTDRHELDGQYLAEKTCKDAITIETRPLVAVGQRVNARSREGRTQHQSSQVMGVARTTLRKFQRDAERRKRSLSMDLEPGTACDAEHSGADNASFQRNSQAPASDAFQIIIYVLYSFLYPHDSMHKMPVRGKQISRPRLHWGPTDPLRRWWVTVNS